MRKALSWAAAALAGLLACSPARAQTRPYIGYVYPAGGQQGTTVQIRLGGQGMDDVSAVTVSGAGVTARIVEYNRRLTNQEQGLIGEQLQALKRAKPKPPPVAPGSPPGTTNAAPPYEHDALIARIEKRISDNVQTPACASISTLLYVEIVIAPDAPPGERELRVITTRGISNPLVFHVGQVREYVRKAMRTATIQVLGKESQSLRKRPPEEVEERIELPCTVNGQIASGEMNLYRFTAQKGQRIVVTTLARQLIPYIADAVPGWFQPVVMLRDAQGREVAYADDFRFKPDPTLCFDVPATGEYVLSIYDAIFRGREDFVYRMTLGELPFVTGIFPLGARVGDPVQIQMRGWNLDGAAIEAPPAGTPAGVVPVVARKGALLSNPVPFALDSLPECTDREGNDTIGRAQKVTLPVVVNGRIDRPDDWDVFRFDGRAGQQVAAEVTARRLDSPLDSVLKLTDADGKLIAFNDDREDLLSGLNTHHADSAFLATLPADGTYYVHLGDTTRKGGADYPYRLRISAPHPDFALRVVPSSVSLRNKNTATLSVYAFRKDGFTNAIALGLRNAPTGYTATAVSLAGTQAVTRLTFKADVVNTNEPVSLVVEGRAVVGEEQVVHDAVPAEDRMQAFLWRHLVPAQDLQVLTFDPNYTLPPRHTAPFRPPPPVRTNVVAATMLTNVVGGVTNIVSSTRGKFTRQQVEGRLRELKRLCEEGLILDDFYHRRVDECEANLDTAPPPVPLKPK